MRIRFGLFGFSFIVLIIVIGTTSCAKHLNDPGSQDRLISYSLSSSNYAPFSNIIYTDSVGAQGLASAADSTSYWTKTIATSIKPFNAQLEVKGQNTTSSTINYTIYIYVDGVVQASKEDSVTSFGSFDSQVSTVVQ